MTSPVPTPPTAASQRHSPNTNLQSLQHLANRLGTAKPAPVKRPRATNNNNASSASPPVRHPATAGAVAAPSVLRSLPADISNDDLLPLFYSALDSAAEAATPTSPPLLCTALAYKDSTCSFGVQAANAKESLDSAKAVPSSLLSRVDAVIVAVAAPSPTAAAPALFVFRGPDGPCRGTRAIWCALQRHPICEVVGFGLTPVIVAMTAQFQQDAALQPPAARIPLMPKLPRCFNDVRVMAKLRAPDASMANDVDAVLDSIADSAIPPRASRAPLNTAMGALQRLQLLPIAYRALLRELQTEGLRPVWGTVEKRLTVTLALMKYTGFPVDVGRVDAARQRAVALEAQYRQRASELVTAASGAAAGAAFNIQSSHDCRYQLYDVLRLHRHLSESDAATASTAKGKMSTNADVLGLLAGHHELPRVILQHRKVAKLRATYFDGLFAFAVPDPASAFRRVPAMSRAAAAAAAAPIDVDDDDETVDDVGGGTPADAITAVFPNFLQEGAETGRLACAEPNIQNLPRTAGANALDSVVRAAFVAPPGCTLLAIDYEQIELRVLAHLSGDAVLRATLSSTDAQSRDIHRSIAARIHSKPAADVTAEERTEAKRVVFGTLYGQGAMGLAAQLRKPVAFARLLQKQFRTSFPGIERFYAHTVARCRADGYVRTLLGRKRPLPDINSPLKAAQDEAERKAFNTAIQASAADVVKKAMVEIADVLGSFPGVAMLCQVHDELIFSVPHHVHGGVRGVAAVLAGKMEGCVELAVPLVAKASAGPNLGELVAL